MASPLRVDVYNAPRVPAVRDPSVDPKDSPWSPLSVTLIHGPNSAVLVDTTFTVSETEKLATWIEETIPNKALEYIFITHGHGDHFFGAPVLLQRFPSAKLVASSSVVEGCKIQLAPAWFDKIWCLTFPNGQISQNQILPTALPSANSFQIDGHDLHAINVEHSDTHASSFLHVPDLQLVVGGDIVYGDCHQYLSEANTSEKRAQWLAALDQIAALKPSIVVPGHKRATQVDGAYLIDATQKYIQDFEAELGRAGNAMELEEAMIKLYPQRINRYALRGSCRANFAARA
jgi:glyoxylase-like metal-dependent hydrolase (beta-lactamase superfamily II)